MTNLLKNTLKTVAISSAIFAAFGFNSFAADNTEEVNETKYGIIETTEDGCMIGADSFEFDEIATVESDVDSAYTVEYVEPTDDSLFEDAGSADDFDFEGTTDEADNEEIETPETEVEVPEVKGDDVFEEVADGDNFYEDAGAEDDFDFETPEAPKHDDEIVDEPETPEVKGDEIFEDVADDSEDNFFEDGGSEDDFDFEEPETPEKPDVKGDDIFPETPEEPTVKPEEPEKVAEPTVEPKDETPVQTVVNDDSNVVDYETVQTGDNADILLYTVLALISLMAIVLLRRKDSKEN